MQPLSLDEKCEILTRALTLIRNQTTDCWAKNRAAFVLDRLGVDKDSKDECGG
jgi:hypothetical protein